MPAACWRGISAITISPRITMRSDELHDALPILLIAVTTGQAWLLFLTAVLTGIADAGGVLAWNLGHHDFAKDHNEIGRATRRSSDLVDCGDDWTSVVVVPNGRSDRHRRCRRRAGVESRPSRFRQGSQ